MTDSEIDHLAEQTAARVQAALGADDQAAAIAAVRLALKQAVNVTTERLADEAQEREG